MSRDIETSMWYDDILYYSTDHASVSESTIFRDWISRAMQRLFSQGHTAIIIWKPTWSLAGSWRNPCISARFDFFSPGMHWFGNPRVTWTVPLSFVTRHAKKGFRINADKCSSRSTLPYAHLIWEVHCPVISQWNPILLGENGQCSYKNRLGGSEGWQWTALSAYVRRPLFAWRSSCITCPMIFSEQMRRANFILTFANSPPPPTA